MIFPIIVGQQEKIISLNGRPHGDNLALIIDFIVAMTAILSRILMTQARYWNSCEVQTFSLHRDSHLIPGEVALGPGGDQITAKRRKKIQDEYSINTRGCKKCGIPTIMPMVSGDHVGIAFSSRKSLSRKIYHC